MKKDDRAFETIMKDVEREMHARMARAIDEIYLTATSELLAELSRWPVEEIKAYRTSDGKLFEDEKEAKRWQARIEFEEWYDGNPVYGNVAGSRVNCAELIDWLFEHRIRVERLYKEQA